MTTVFSDHEKDVNRATAQANRRDTDSAIMGIQKVVQMSDAGSDEDRHASSLPSDLISRREAMVMQGYKSPRSVYRQERAGLLVAYKISSRATRYRRSDVLKLIADSAVNAGGAQ